MKYKNLKNPHDRFFRESMQCLEIVQNLLKLYVDPQIMNKIDFSSLKINKDLWIDTELSQHFAYTIYCAKFKSKRRLIYILFEHKNYRDRNVALQNLYYMSLIWYQILKSSSEIQKLPIVIPIIIYNGPRQWNYENSLKPLFEIYEGTDKYIPDYKAVVIDLNTINEKETGSSVVFRTFITALKYGTRKKILMKLPEIIRSFNLSTSKEQDYLSVALVYIGSVIPQEERSLFLETIKQEYYDGVHYMKSVVDSLCEEGFLIGIKEGIEEGKKTQKMDDQVIYAKKMIKKNVNIKDIHFMTGLSISKIESIKRNEKKSRTKATSKIQKKKGTIHKN